MATVFYLRPHDGSLAIGPFTVSDDAVTWYHANVDLSGCDVVAAVDQSEWPAPGNSLVYRFELQNPPVVP